MSSLMQTVQSTSRGPSMCLIVVERRGGGAPNIAPRNPPVLFRAAFGSRTDNDCVLWIGEVSGVGSFVVLVRRTEGRDAMYTRAGSLAE